MDRKLDKTMQTKICSVIGFGGTREMAARVVGINRWTIWATAKRDKAFADALRQAEETPELTYLMAVAEAANAGKQWRAALWALERMFPERFAKRSPTAFTLDQMREVIDTVIATISRSVPGKVTRETIRRKIESYARSLGKTPNRKQLLRRKRHGK
jgi:hypothetical protein